ncbi:T6SS immunity protein Tdi1 domain-containing protein [Idiomarina sp.]|uniref:T6SS immunity protein Tdi1 domain-containing protein n=1 Tax=Idiomarina sp. TaxID=1874361 RepID=UPI003A8F17B2
MSIIQEIKDSWGWVGIEPLATVAENDFGNLMVEDVYGKFWRLSPEDLYCEIVANDRAELELLSEDQNFLKDWYMQALVEQAKESLGAIPEGHKYCLVIPGALGGAYETSNIKTTPLIELVRFSGDLAKQIKDFPEGAKIQLRAVE